MPINLTKFIIRKPRVPSINAIPTLPPTSSGTYDLLDAFTIEYTGLGATAQMHITAKMLTTIVDNDRTHADNLSVNIANQTLSDVLAAITNPNYTTVLQGAGTDDARLVGQIDVNIKAVPVQVQYGIPAEYLVEAENTAKFGSATVRWVKDKFKFSDRDSNWFIDDGEVYDATGVAVPVNGQVVLENGINIDLTANPENLTADLAKIKTETDQILIAAAGSEIEFVIMPVLQYLVPGTMQVKFNNVLKTEDVDFVLSSEDKRLNFLRTIANENHVLTSPNLTFVDANVQGAAGVIVETIQVKRNGNPLTANVDYITLSSSLWQTKDVGSGRISFTETFLDDPIAEYVLSTEGALFNDDFILKKNGIPLDTSEYLTVFEAGFVNTNVKMFPGDIVTATYRSKEMGQITDEILTGTPATVENAATVKSFEILAGVNDTLVTAGDGNAPETITLPIGTVVNLTDIIAAYNAQAVNTFMAYNTAHTHFIISSRKPGPASSVEVFDGNANGVLVLATGITNGAGSIGGEFAFDLANAPVEITSFSAPLDGDTFFIKESDVSTSYAPGTLIQINNDLYLTDTVGTVTRATLYNTPSSVVYRISEDINDTFILTVDGTQYTVMLTAGDRLAADIVADINLIVNIASVETFNNTDFVKLESPTAGLGGSIVINNGTANGMVGFTNLQKDTGLTDTRVKVLGKFGTAYNNPLLRTTKKPVVFLTEPTAPEKSPPGNSTLSFNGVDISAQFKKRTVVKHNDDLYFVFGVSYQNNKTTVQLNAPLKNPVFTTDVIKYTKRPVFIEGTVDLSLSEPAITDLPIIVKNNGIPLPPNGYKVNSNGSITLSDANKLSSSSNITASYTSFAEFDDGDVITLDYRIFSNVNEGTEVKASYQYDSPDKFYLDLIYENSLTGKIFDRINQQLTQIANPSSTGFISNAGGDTANSDAGNETPTLGEFKYRYEDDIGKTLFDFYDKRITAFTDERKFYNGMIVGGDDGPVTEAQLQLCIDPVSRLFTLGYTKTVPIRVPAFDALNKKDDGSVTGGVNGAVAMLDALNAELADVIAENALLTTLLGITTGGGVSVLGTANASSVTFYDGTGPDPVNNVLLWTRDGIPLTVTFTASGPGVVTSLASIIGQIGAGASQSGNQVLLSGTNSVTIQAGSANTVLGFTNGGGAANRSGSPEYAQWKALVGDEIAKNTISITSQNAILALHPIILQEYVGVYIPAFDETRDHQTYLSGTFDTEIDDALTQNNADFNMDINNNLNITNRRDITNPARILELNDEIATVTARLLQIENYFLGKFSQAQVGAAVFTGQLPGALVFNGTDDVTTVVTAFNTANPANQVSFTGIAGVTVLAAQTVTLIAMQGEGLLDNRYAWASFRTNRADGTIQSIKRALDNQNSNAEQVEIDESLLEGLT